MGENLCSSYEMGQQLTVIVFYVVTNKRLGQWKDLGLFVNRLVGRDNTLLTPRGWVINSYLLYLNYSSLYFSRFL